MKSTLFVLILAIVAWCSGPVTHPTQEEYELSVINCSLNPELMGCGDKYYY